jgi:hypothetical protein
MTIVAKPIIDKQFWILQENDRKVGNIEACDGGFQVKINNQVAQFKTIRMAAQRANIQFESSIIISKPKMKVNANLVHGYPTSGRVYNPIWDVKMKLPIYTKTNKSKSWFAAGWYQVKKGRSWSAVQDPKLIALQRYPYAGPFYTEKEAHEHSFTKVC